MNRFVKLVICVCVVFFLFTSLSVHAAVEVTPYKQIHFEMCGAGWVATALAEIQGYNAGWRAASARGEIVEVASSNIFTDIMAGGITKVFPRAAIVQFLSKLDQESLQYGPVQVDSTYAAPSGCSVVGTNIECDVPPEGKTLVLFSWNFVIFVDTEAVADGTGDFDGLASGNYVVGFTGDEFTTPFLTIP